MKNKFKYTYLWALLVVLMTAGACEEFLNRPD